MPRQQTQQLTGRGLLRKAEQLQSAGRVQDAEPLYRSFLKLNPGHAGAACALGILCSQQNRLEESNRLLERVVRVQPDVMAYFTLGCNAATAGYDDAAADYYEKALALAPRFFEAHHNRANALQRLGRYEEALRASDAAIAVKSDAARHWCTRGSIQYCLAEYMDALASFEKAITLSPDYPDAHLSMGIVRLQLGRFEEGWRHFEWRWRSKELRDKAIPSCPLWVGETSPAGKTIVLYAEQGIGDTIQFCRYVPLVERLGATVILAVQKAVVPLLRSLRSRCTVLPDDQPLPPCELRCPLLSLPLATGTRVDSIPADVPYLYADPERQEVWHTRLGSRSAPRIGLVWSGASGHANDRNRSIPLKAFTPLLDLNCELHSLQKEYRKGDLEFLAATRIVTHHTRLVDFADTAALVMEMDLVLSVDTSVVHLTGALGKPVWILLPHVSDWRWLTGRDDSPWYPTARLFRQRHRGDWPEVLARVRGELATRIAL